MDLSVSNVLDLREKVAVHLEQKRTLPAKERTAISSIRSLLDKKSLKISDFFTKSVQVNLLEVDRCVRFRSLRDPEKPALCDGCRNRSKVPCYDPAAVCFVSKRLYYNAMTPNSLMMEEQMRFSKLVDFKPSLIISPLSYYFSMGGDHLKYCVGEFLQIADFSFDVLWGMDAFIAVGLSYFNAMAPVDLRVKKIS